MLKSEEVEENKRKIQTRIKDLQDQLEAANNKIVNMERQRARTLGELDDAQVEAERNFSLASALEKKEQSFDRTVDEWRRKHDDLNSELDASQREVRNLGAESFKLKAVNDEIVEQVKNRSTIH